MRVTLIHNRYAVRGGEDAVVERQVAWLSAAGHQVRCLEADNRRLQGWGQRLQAGLEAPWSAVRYGEARALLEAFGPDVSHVHNWFPQLTPAVLDAHRDLGVPLVQTLHNYRLGCAAGTYLRDGQPCTRCEGGERVHALRGRCYRASLLQTLAWERTMRAAWAGPLLGVDAFLAPSRTVAARHRAMGLPAARIHVLPHAVPDPLRGDEPSAPRAEEGALFVGRLSPEKGVDVLLEAWRGVPHPLRIVGTGPDEAALREQARDLPQVELLGALPPAEVQALMARCAFLVLPHRWLEPFGLVVLEAMACGRPVLTSDLGGPAEVVRHGGDGLLTRPGDPLALRAAALELFGRRRALEALGRTARAAYLASYTPERHVARLVELYRGLRRRLPRCA